jgi:hypothetical protein
MLYTQRDVLFAQTLSVMCERLPSKLDVCTIEDQESLITFLHYGLAFSQASSTKFVLSSLFAPATLHSRKGAESKIGAMSTISARGARRLDDTGINNNNNLIIIYYYHRAQCLCFQHGQ